MISKVRIGVYFVLATFSFYQARAVTPLSLGTTYAGAIAVPGQTNAFTFTGTPGQRIFFDSLDSDNLQIYVKFLSPGGVVLSQLLHTTETTPWLLTEPGTYTVAFNGSASTTGTYNFRLLDLSSAPALKFGSTTSDQLSPALGCNMYQFSGKRGQRISVQWGAFSTNQVQWQFISPANAVLAQGQTAYQNLQPTTLPIDGSYVLLVQGIAAGNSPVTFQFLASDLSEAPVATSGLGIAHAGNISANATNSFTFTAPAGLPLYFDNLDTSGQSLVVDLIDPTTNVVFSIAETADSGPWLLPHSGTYTVNVRGPNGASGNFNFRLLDLTQSPALTLSTSTTNTLALAYQTDFYQVSGNAGQRLFYENLANPSVYVPVSLLGPDGGTPIATTFYNNQGPVTLPATGTYYLRFQNTTASSTPYQFSLIDCTAQPSLPLNTDLVSSIPAGINRFYQLNATAGQKLYFNGNVSVGGAYWSLFDTRNVGVSGNALGGDFQVTLNYDGNYLVQIAGASSTAINYSNRVNTITYSTLPLTLGATVSNNIVNSGDRLYYTFSGTAGQRVYYDGLNPNYLNITVGLYTPSGLNPFSGNASSSYGPVTLPQTGTYTLVFGGSGHVTGPVMFTLFDVAAQPSLPLNTDLTGNLPPLGAQLYTFSGTTGESLYFHGKYASAGGGYWTLYGPNNLYVGSAGLASDFEPKLPNAGTYLLVFANGGNPLTFTNQVNTYSVTTNALSLGTVATNNLVNPGDQVFYSFTGTAGQRIYFDSLVSTYSSINLSLYAPDGTSLVLVNASTDYGPLTLPMSGTYYLQINGNGHTVGPISFQILDINAQPSLPVNTDLVGTLAPFTAQIYKLAGTAGDRLYFNAKAVAGGGASWYLYGPNNAAINGNSLGGDFEQTLAASGTYALVLANAPNPVTFSNQVNTFSYNTNALSLGSAITTSIVNPGDQLYYTFTGTAGQRLYFDSRSTNYLGVSVVLLSPTGATVISGNSYGDMGPFTLTQNGTYTLVLDGSGHTTGVISFQLLDLSAAAPLTLGTPITDSLVDQTQTKLYKFTGTQGQRLNLQSLSASGNNAVWTLMAPSDQPLGSQPYITGNIGIVTLPVTGTYTLEVIGYGVAQTPVTYQLGVTDISDAPVASSGFGVVNSGTVGASQTNSYTYTASAGTPVFFDSQDASGQTLIVDLVAPDGTTVFSLSETSDSPYIYTLPRSGTYKANVRGYNGSSGNYSFRLLDLGASPQLPLNTANNGTLNNPYETDVYQLAVSSGQVLSYNALSTDANYPSVFVSLIDPHGQGIGPSSDFQNNRGPFVVQYAGTSYFFLRNAKAAASAYSFQMVDMAAQPVLPINVGVTNTLGVYQQMFYRYNGAAGQRLYFRGLSSNPSGYWTLYDPNALGVSGASASMAGDFSVTLPYAGSYNLVFTSYASSPGTEIFQVTDYNYSTNAYTLGSQVVDAINRPGEAHLYTFTGTAGQHLVYDALTNSLPAGSISATLYNPLGIQEGPVAGSAFWYDRGPFTLSLSGTYTLVFAGNGSTVGPFAFQLLDLAAQSSLPINTGVTNTMSVYAEQVYKYSGTAGQLLYFKGNSANQPGTWQLFDENNNSVQSASLTGDMNVTLPITGTYCLILGSYSGTAGPELFQVTDFHYYTNAYTLGTPIFDSLNRPGEERSYTFTGTKGQRLIYNGLTNDPPSPNIIYMQLLNPDGATEIVTRFSANPSPFTLLESGTYTLQIYGQGASVGAYAFQLMDIAAQPLLPTTGGVTNTLGVFAEQVYQYPSVVGQNLYFRGFSSNPSGYWYICDPNNSTIAGSGLISDMQVTLSLPGTYVLVIENQQQSAKTETFQVNPFDYTETVTPNRAPVLTHIADPVFAAGVLVNFTALATDPDTGDTLTFSLDPGSPAGATIDPSSGLFSWNPPITGLSSVTPVTVRVTDNGIPPQSAAQIVNVEVIAGPAMISAQPSNGVVNVSWHSAPGKHYQIQYKNELEDAAWLNLGTTFTASALISIQVDTTAIPNTHRFYRVQALDPLQ